MDLKEIGDADPQTHWYYQSKLVAIRRAVEKWSPERSQIVDVGAGSGFFSREIARFDLDETVVCVDPNYAQDWDEEQGRLRFVRSGDGVTGDTYLFVDVLEHVPDDVALLRQYVASSSPGSTFYITVPAFMSLWSGHDVFLEHYRRYRLSEVVRVAQAAGLQVLHHRYLFGSVFPPAWLVRKLRRRQSGSDMSAVPSPLNTALRAIVSTEHRYDWNRAFGLTAFVVARRSG